MNALLHFASITQNLSLLFNYSVTTIINSLVTTIHYSVATVELKGKVGNYKMINDQLYMHNILPF